MKRWINHKVKDDINVQDVPIIVRAVVCEQAAMSVFIQQRAAVGACVGECEFARLARVDDEGTVARTKTILVLVLFLVFALQFASEEGGEASLRGRIVTTAALIDGLARALADLVNGGVHGGFLHVGGVCGIIAGGGCATVGVVVCVGSMLAMPTQSRHTAGTGNGAKRLLGSRHC